jgi:nucleoside-triphosphatase
MKVVLVQKNLLITGRPGTGKTTLIKKLSAELEGYRPLGFYTAEIRKGGQRLGFELVSLDGKRGLLSHVKVASPYHVGKYRVDLRGFENFLDAIPFFDPANRLIVIDEIGKMECLSHRFQSLVKELLDSEKWVIAAVALKGAGLIEEVKKRRDAKMFEVSERNRDDLPVELLEEVRANLVVR